MTEENKKLLLKDLCARLPYRVKAQCGSSETNIGEIVGVNIQRGQVKTRINFYNIKHIKPYLRPMSNMTEKEREEFRAVGGVMSYSPQNDTWAISAFAPEAYDWLNKNMFDYRGLIPIGLALEAHKDMYKF